MAKMAMTLSMAEQVMIYYRTRMVMMYIFLVEAMVAILLLMNVRLAFGMILADRIAVARTIRLYFVVMFVQKM